MAGNEEIISEYKCQNGATVSRADRCRLLRCGNDGWLVDNVWAVAQRCFAIDFNFTVPFEDRNPFLGQELEAEAPLIAAACLKAFYSFYPSTPNWYAQPWHRIPLMKGVYTAESRAVQHALVVGLEEGTMEWGGETDVPTVDHLTVAFCQSTRRLCGPPVYKFYSITTLGWQKEVAPFGVWVEGSKVKGIKMLN